MKNLNSRNLCAAALLLAFPFIGCAMPTSPSLGSESLAAESPVDGYIGGGEIPYVLGALDGQSLQGGSHHLLIPTEDGREPIDAANRANRLHPALVGDYLKVDFARSSGEAEWDVFASNWWPQSQNGIANRWNSSDRDYESLTDKKNLSPSEKYDLLFYPGQEVVVDEVKNWPYPEMQKPEDERGPAKVHPRVRVTGPATAWELRNHGAYQHVFPDGWWGHCNGWASYATAEPDGAPKRDVYVRLEAGEIVECTEAERDQCVFFRMGDIEALMSELYFSDAATFSGRRCNTNPDEIERDEWGRPLQKECRDINAGTMHIAMTGLLGRGAPPFSGDGPEKRLSFVIDHNWDWQVWNFPVKKFAVTDIEEVDEESALALVREGQQGEETDEYPFNENATRFARVDATYHMVSDNVGVSQMLLQASERSIPLHPVDLHYVLELDSRGTILGGEWIQDPKTSWGEDSKELHPDFLWAAVNHRGWGEDKDDRGGDDDNPFVAYSAVKTLLQIANSDAPPPPAHACAGACGGQAEAGCYCDSACERYGDCCQDGEGRQGEASTYVCELCTEEQMCR